MSSPEYPGQIVTDGTTLFWTGGQNVSGTTNEVALYSCPVGGCSSASTLFSAQGAYVSMGNLVFGASTWASDLFFPYDAASSSVFSLAKTGGTATPIVSGLASGPGAVAYDAINNWVYTPGGQVVYRAKPDGTQSTTALTGASSIFYVYVDSTNFYTVDNDEEKVSYAPLGSTNAAGTVLLAAGTLKTFRDMYADGSNVWITDMGSGGTAGDGVVYKCPVGQTCTTANQFATGQLDPWAIVADGTNVYWSDFTAYSIVKCPLAGCPSTGPIPVASTNVGSAGSLAQDATFLYFTNGSQVQEGGEVAIAAPNLVRLAGPHSRASLRSKPPRDPHEIVQVLGRQHPKAGRSVLGDRARRAQDALSFRRERDDLRSPVLRVRLAQDEPARLEVVHDDGRGRSVRRHRLGELPERERAATEAPQRPHAREGEPGRVADLAAPVPAAVHDERDEELPGPIQLARSTLLHFASATSWIPAGNWRLALGTASGVSRSRRNATLSALARARDPVDTSPSTVIARPYPTISQKTTWVEAAKSARCADSIPAPATDPASATPREMPTCRLVEATAAASPAWERGIPETAVFVIGEFTHPSPTPNTA